MLYCAFADMAFHIESAHSGASGAIEWYTRIYNMSVHISTYLCMLKINCNVATLEFGECMHAQIVARHTHVSVTSHGKLRYVPLAWEAASNRRLQPFVEYRYHCTTCFRLTVTLTSSCIMTSMLYFVSRLGHGVAHCRCGSWTPCRLCCCAYACTVSHCPNLQTWMLQHY